MSMFLSATANLKPLLLLCRNSRGPCFVSRLCIDMMMFKWRIKRRKDLSFVNRNLYKCSILQVLLATRACDGHIDSLGGPVDRSNVLHAKDL